MSTSHLLPLTLLRRPQVEAMTGLKKSSIYALMHQGRFPARVHITRRAVGWPLAAVQQWIEERVQGAGQRMSVDVTPVQDRSGK